MEEFLKWSLLSNALPHQPGLKSMFTQVDFHTELQSGQISENPWNILQPVAGVVLRDPLPTMKHNTLGKNTVNLY